MEKKEVVTTAWPTFSPVSAVPHDNRIPTRLVVCVDGIRYDPKADSQQTNVYRIYASVKSGQCVDSQSGITYNQVPRYFAGLGAADDIISKDKLQNILPGQGFHQQIQDVYEACCKLSSDGDEVVFFGFARGAYAVRAVCGLLHQFGILVPSGEQSFAKVYKKIRKDVNAISSPMSPQRSNTLSSFYSEAGSEDYHSPPRIRFVGVFETVKAVSDESTYDISFNSSIKHLRHALALHEDRKALAPELVYPEQSYSTKFQDQGRSEVQAWFIGTHQDIGGTSPKAGLGLYPLQWMLLEARTCGLWIDFEGTSEHRGLIEKPLSVVFPKASTGKNREQPAITSFTTSNGVVVTMQNLQTVHDRKNSNGHYAVKLSTRPGTVRLRQSRKPFDANGYLLGFCDQAPQGTIIHPSVYLLLDEHLTVALDTKEAKLQRNIEDWRPRMLGPRTGPTDFNYWDDEDDITSNPGAIRVLVCGNTGAGKSTLINKTFGVEVTPSSDRARGIHDVKQAITFPGRPDLIVHDSGGFEAGAEAEFIAIESFLKEKSTAVEVQDRLHVIWFCIEINTARTMQVATEKLFQAVSKYANDVPIVVVATKKDDLLDLEFSKRRRELKKLRQPVNEEACEQFAEEQLQTRLEQIRNELESVPEGRLDALVAVSYDDDESIANLSKTTSQCFDIDNVRLLYIRAQVARIDLKVDLALCEVMRRYRGLLRRATSLSFTITGSTIHRNLASTKACKAIMNCFGLPSVSAETAIDALKQNVWNHTGFDVSVALAECLNTIGYMGTGFAGGIPVWLVSGALSIPLVVPSTCRLFLTMACDLILTLVRSFREATFRAAQMPNDKDVQAAARIYRIRGFSQHIQTDVKKLVPKRNTAACYKYEMISQTLERNISAYRQKLMDDVDLEMDLSLDLKRLAVNGDDGDDESLQSGPSIFSEIREANKKAIELEAASRPAELPDDNLVSELSATENERCELPGHELSHELEGTNVVVAELEAVGSVPKVHELHG